jgi:hypothetical protein
MLSLEYRHANKEKAKNFMANLKNKLNLENLNKEIEIMLAPNPSKKYNQFYYKIIIK